MEFSIMSRFKKNDSQEPFCDDSVNLHFIVHMKKL